MISIGIINRGPLLNWGKNFGYWYLIKYFYNELRSAGYEINFYESMSSKFYKSDFIIIDSRSITEKYTHKIRKKLKLSVNYNFLETILKIQKKNPNIVWLDLTDSSGTTQFEVLPYVRKYVKKQFYKDKSFYKKNFFRDRYYADFYQKKFSLEKNINFKTHLLTDKYLSKLVLGWNIGVGNYFDVLNRDKYEKYLCILKSLKSNDSKDLYKYCLGFHKPEKKLNDVYYSFNLRNNDEKKSIHFQRNKVTEMMIKYFKSKNLRLGHKEYLKRLKQSKISIGAFGWGEVCYREFEAIKMGAAVIFPSVDYIETWPNIYRDNYSYVSYKLDFSNLIDKINLVSSNKDLRENLVENSQRICKNVYSNEGLEYLINFFKKITN